MSISYQTEPWATFYPDAKFIWHQHWRELGIHQEHYSIDCDVERYQQLDANGILLTVTARDDEELVGYLMSFLMPHLHYKSAGTMAYTDMYYVLPEYRKGTGMHLFKYWEEELRKRKVVNAMTSCKVHQDHTRFLELMGFKHTDNTFAKYLGG